MKSHAETRHVIYKGKSRQMGPLGHCNNYYTGGNHRPMSCFLADAVTRRITVLSTFQESFTGRGRRFWSVRGALRSIVHAMQLELSRVPTTGCFSTSTLERMYVNLYDHWISAPHYDYNDTVTAALS